MHTHSHPHEPIPPTRGRLIRWAWLYDRSVGWFLEVTKLRAMTIDVARIELGETILDVGCGTGDLCFAAKACVGQTGTVYGLDAAPEMIAVARQKAAHRQIAVDFRVSAVEAMPFPDASCDVVLSSLMMHHLPLDVKRLGLLEIRRVLKPSGRLVIIDLKRPRTFATRVIMALSLHGAMPIGVQDLTPLLAECGFVHIQGDMTWRMLGFVIGRIKE